MIEHSGKTYARVSDIIRPFSNFGHINPDVLANKARIGTEVHQAIADDINEEFCVVDQDSCGYFYSYCKWRGTLNPKFLASEQRYFCDKKMLTGQIDTLINLPNEMDLPTLVDFKTSAQESKETWEMQAHLYNYLLESNGIKVAPRYLFVKLNKMGSLPQVFSYTWNSNTHAKCMKAIEDFWKSDKK